MANRLWSLGVPPEDEIDGNVVPIRRGVNAENINRLYLDHHRDSDTYVLTLYMVDKSKTTYTFDDRAEAEGAYDTWRKRVEYAGASTR